MINWNNITPDLGSITPNILVNIKLTATSDFDNESIFYTITQGSLPSGLTLNLNGTITGKVLQETASFDNSTISYTFTVKAQGITSLDFAEQNFELAVNLVSYKDIKVKAFLSPSQRQKWNEFINNEDIFVSKYLYNYTDKHFGVNKELEMLIFAGIEDVDATQYISAIGLNHKKKQLHFGNIRIARGIPPGERDSEYEVIYVEIIDPLEIDNKILPKKIKASLVQQEYLTSDYNNDIFWTRDVNKLDTPSPNWNRIRPNMNSDTTGYFTSDPNPNIYFSSSINNWRKQIRDWREESDIENDGFFIERNFLPLWMRTIQFQDNQYQELGYTSALVLCYCLPNMATRIVKNIKNYIETTGFQFNQFDFTVDRFVIENNHIIFRNNSNTIY